MVICGDSQRINGRVRGGRRGGGHKIGKLWFHHLWIIHFLALAELIKINTSMCHIKTNEIMRFIMFSIHFEEMEVKSERCPKMERFCQKRHTIHGMNYF